MKKIALVLVILLALIGCSKKEVVYNPPEALMFDETTLSVSWQSVKDAIAYEISIDDTIFKTANTYHDLSDLESGIYTVKVRSVFKDSISRYSLAIKVTIVKAVSIDFSLNNDVLALVSHTSGIKYQVTPYDYMGNKNASIKLESNTYKVVSDIGFKRLDIKATLNSVVVFDQTVMVNVDGYTYFKGEDHVMIPNVSGNKVYLGSILLDESNYVLTDLGLSISKTYLETLALDTYLLKVEGNQTLLTYITFSETQKPRLTSSSNVMYESKDVIFTFELYGGTFLGVYATPDLSEGYVFESGTLTIKKSYIDKIIESEPNRTQIFFQYEVQNNELTVVGYLTIRLK